MNIRSLLIKLGGFLLAPIGAIHDALRGSEPGILSSSTISQSASSQDATDATIGNTLKYYIGGTFLVTFLVVVFSCGGFAALGKKKRTYKRKRKPAAKRRRSTTKRRRTSRIKGTSWASYDRAVTRKYKKRRK